MHSVPYFFKTPLTDITGSLFTHQNFGRCRNMEMKVINCFEAYGGERAKTSCKDLIDDYHECYLKFKQVNQISIINKV